MQNEEIEALVSSVKSDDNKALWQIYDFYKPLILKTCSIVKDAFPTVDRDDLISESVFVVKSLCLSYDPEKGYFPAFMCSRFRAYLISKVKSTYLMKESTFSEITGIIDEMDSSHVVIDDWHLDIDHALESLKENERQAIEMHYFGGLNYTECAKEIGISRPAFKKRLDIAIGKMQKIME